MGDCINNKKSAKRAMPRFINKRKIVFAFVAWLLPALAAADVVIGIVEDGPLPRPIIPLGMLEAEILDLVGDEFSVSMPESKRIDGGWTLERIRDALARQLAEKSIVLLKNEGNILPLAKTRGSIAVIGPLADAPYEQLGTWIFDGDPQYSVTPLQAIRDLIGGTTDVRFLRALEISRSRDTSAFDEAVSIASESDAGVLFLGEESILSGEAHSRADISLPGAQAELVRRVRETGTPVAAVILAGRPLTLSNIVDEVDAILYAWHPGTMGGPAIADLLFGIESPSGKLPATFPRMVGQVPIYYSQKHTGKPPSPDTVVLIDDIDARAPQLSTGMTAYHLDAGYTPLFAFGHGLSYATFDYEDIRASAAEIRLGEPITISAELTNTSDIAADEVVQLYVRDLVGNVTRPVKELKGFRRVRLEPGQQITVAFELHTDDLAFFGRDNTLITEPGEFHAWIGGSSETELRTEFRIVADR